ncbi:MAG: hypothetical protein Q9159_007153 [Coniocarpon cinnabarinum]
MAIVDQDLNSAIGEISYMLNPRGNVEKVRIESRSGQELSPSAHGVKDDFNGALKARSIIDNAEVDGEIISPYSNDAAGADPASVLGSRAAK